MQDTSKVTRTGWSREETELLFAKAREARECGMPLKKVFDEVASDTRRKPNSIRNYYYSQVKAEAEEASFHSAAFVPFTREEVDSLVREVLLAQSRGISVRACTLSLGHGDTKAMLRYQNKYRSVVKNDPATVRRIIAELEAEGVRAFDPYGEKEARQSATARFKKLSAVDFFAELEALAAKYRKLVM